MGDDRFDAIEREPCADAVGIVTLVQCGELKDILGGQALVEMFKGSPIVRLPRCEVQRDAAVFIQGRGVNLGG